MKEYTPEKPKGSFFVQIDLLTIQKPNLIADHLHCVGREIDFYSSKYDNFVVLGDLNTEVYNSSME